MDNNSNSSSLTGFDIQGTLDPPYYDLLLFLYRNPTFLRALPPREQARIVNVMKKEEVNLQKKDPTFKAPQQQDTGSFSNIIQKISGGGIKEENFLQKGEIDQYFANLQRMIDTEGVENLSQKLSQGKGQELSIQLEQGIQRLQPNTSGAPVGQFIQDTPEQYRNTIAKASIQHGVPTNILSALLKQESGFNPTAKSSAGATGIAQFMPATAQGMGVDPLNPDQSIDGAARYLKQNYDKYGSWDLALAAYNAGPGNVDKYNGIPPFKETQNYVKNIMESSNTIKPVTRPKEQSVKPKENIISSLIKPRSPVYAQTSKPAAIPSFNISSQTIQSLKQSVKPPSSPVVRSQYVPMPAKTVRPYIPPPPSRANSW